MKNLRGKRVLVYGMGGSGNSACRLLHKLGACVSVFDDDKKYRSLFCFDEQPLCHKYDLVVVSPGIKVIGNTLISGFRSKKTQIISEIDLGSQFCKGKLIAITGTNGKTTTCSLLGKIFEEAGKKVAVCGNIGLPISSIALSTDKKSFVVCETSNFQLELSSIFSPDIACVLNIAPDHIDRHGTFEEYKRVKNSIFKNFRRQNKAVVNLDDEMTMSLDLPKNVEYFSLNPLKKGVCIKNGYIYHGKTRIVGTSDISLLGDKNMSNVMAAVTIALLCKIKTKYIRYALMRFSPPAHRLQFVGEFSGVRYINDSKATNIACVDMAIESLNVKNLVLMLGGQNKDLDFSLFFARHSDIKQLICFGQAGEQIAEIAKAYGYEPHVFESLKSATKFAKENAQRGDTVLLSPGCTSFDEFSSYAVRGQIFMELVKGES